MEQNESEYGTVELNGKKYMYLVNDEYVEYLGDKDGNVYKGSYESGKLKSVTLVASPKSNVEKAILSHLCACLLYTSDAADDLLCVDPVGRRIIKKKKQKKKKKPEN